MSLASANKIDILKDRAIMLCTCRHFFAKKKIMEVDVPILSHTSSVDVHIDPIQATCCGRAAYMHTSPEYGMKRLLSEGIGDIYQISHVFRDCESGPRHTPEFMMIEWYRIGFTFQEMIDETLELIRLFLTQLPVAYEQLSYREAFFRYVGRFPQALEERDELYAFEIEPHLGKEALTVIAGFEPEQAALARISKEGIAERFEVYYQGIELANGYHELICAKEQRERIARANQQRRALNKSFLPVDEAFIESLEQGMPDCSGVAVGFDRLMMLRHQLEEIREASSFFI
jgi:elongation factor P--(R)-beta-lysine ligase